MFKIDHEELYEWIIRKGRFKTSNPKDASYTIEYDPDQEQTWTGYAHFKNNTVSVTVNGKRFSKTDERGVSYRTFNHYEVLLVAMAHELKHLDQGHRFAHDEEPDRTARAVLRRHRRRPWWFIKAFFMKGYRDE